MSETVDSGDSLLTFLRLQLPQSGQNGFICYSTILLPDFKSRSGALSSFSKLLKLYPEPFPTLKMVRDPQLRCYTVKKIRKQVPMAAQATTEFCEFCGEKLTVLLAPKRPPLTLTGTPLAQMWRFTGLGIDNGTPQKSQKLESRFIQSSLRKCAVEKFIVSTSLMLTNSTIRYTTTRSVWRRLIL